MNNGATSSASATPAAALPKPIRFVTNHDGPYAKRRRINSACLTCRRKKTRCSGERPVCGTCKQNKHECLGYGSEADPSNPTSPTDTTKDGKKGARRESNGAANATKIKQEAPSRPPLQHKSSSASQNPDSPAHHRPFRVDSGDGTGNAALTLSTRNRMPYFRYFGPTAIMPGFKQMVVKVRGKQHSTGHTASDPLESSTPGQPPSVGSPPVPEARTPLEIPVYDTSAMSPSPLITHLCKLFFVHLGCNFPFLQKDRFMRDLEEKQVDAILVDAVCALSARFSNHPLLTGQPDPPKDGMAEPTKIHPSEYGQAFAQRAKCAIPDAFPCPSVAVVQAALLLAYDEFGASRDSGLWMYLGISIRMAQDLGMQTLQGLKYEGRDGPTPKSIKTGPNGKPDDTLSRRPSSTDPDIEEQRAVERERLDTFWSLFFLDRVISSGTGRPVTLRDRDIEISFPSLDEVDPPSGWPLPFPALIRIIHLYGRVTDLLNSIKEKADVTDDLQKQLNALEFQLTEIYQGLSPKLHFTAVNFQHYVKINQGTNFLLLHCWFHTLIVLLHQPTLLKTFEGSTQPLSSNSRELSMSSAKTVADILAFTELIDTRTGVGNPFTSQPIYIAACAFLKESALHSASSNPHSRPSTPGSAPDRDPMDVEKTSLDHMKFEKHLVPPNGERPTNAHDHAAKHTLLASAANQNYQRCSRALKSLETYWSGVKYILTVLDQKAKGVGDPLLYTREEMESALELPRPEPSFNTPGWRRKLSWGTYLTPESVDVDHAAKMPAALRHKGARTPTIPGSPMPIASQAIGWSLTGTMNSPSTNVAVMYPADTREVKQTPSSLNTLPSPASILAQPSASNPPIDPRLTPTFSMLTQQPFNPASMPPPPTQNTSSTTPFNSVPTPDPVLVSDADLLLNLHSPFSTASPNTSRLPSLRNSSTSAPNPGPPQDHLSPPGAAFASAYPTPDGTTTNLDFGNMDIISHELDMSVLGQEMMPWDLEYLPHDLVGFYGTEAPFVDDAEGGAGTEP
ncbi:hypothetical protein EJ04DRAFT_479233 [Polyplosphaeria fusca]|uniref:Zn(2)-C6 fungal-type domain-containing protein n=1 Tax=Polyplosphaeria fusca TaxID=682080 RepID=A0A9P4QM63_9PLEO|nr:hypothetical protein EJ04DRAFT_479233 [Polyplosphaeria fusca]